MGAISRPWYNGSDTMAAKPIKSLELHYTMIQFLIKKDNGLDLGAEPLLKYPPPSAGEIFTKTGREAWVEAW